MTLARSALVQRIRWNLGDNVWETTGTAANTSSVVVVADGGDWTEGDIGEIIDAVTGDVEAFRDAGQHSGNNITATRGYYGTTAAAHLTSSRILKNPKFKDAEITNAISETIRGLPWPKIYKVVSTTITPTSSGGWGSAWGSSPWGSGSGSAGAGPWYNLNAEALAIQSAFQLDTQTPPGVRTFGSRHSWNRIILQRNLPTSLVASGVGVGFPDGVTTIDTDVQISYAAKITDTQTSSVYQDFSAGEAVVDAIVFGATAKLQAALELRKPRHGTDEVDNLRVGAAFDTLYKKALWTAEKDLRQQKPLLDGWDK